MGILPIRLPYTPFGCSQMPHGYPQMCCATEEYLRATAAGWRETEEHLRETAAGGRETEAHLRETEAG